MPQRQHPGWLAPQTQRPAGHTEDSKVQEGVGQVPVEAVLASHLSSSKPQVAPSPPADPVLGSGPAGPHYNNLKPPEAWGGDPQAVVPLNESSFVS